MINGGWNKRGIDDDLKTWFKSLEESLTRKFAHKRGEIILPEKRSGFLNIETFPRLLENLNCKQRKTIFMLQSSFNLSKHYILMNFPRNSPPPPPARSRPLSIKLLFIFQTKTSMKWKASIMGVKSKNQLVRRRNNHASSDSPRLLRWRCNKTLCWYD